MMIFGQGAIRCHPYVLEEMAAAQSNDVNAFDKLLFKHIGHVGSNKVRSFWLGLTRGLTSSTPTGDATKRYYQHLNRLSANLALLSDVSMAVKQTCRWFTGAFRMRCTKRNRRWTIC